MHYAHCQYPESSHVIYNDQTITKHPYADRNNYFDIDDKAKVNIANNRSTFVITKVIANIDYFNNTIHYNASEHDQYGSDYFRASYRLSLPITIAPYLYHTSYFIT